MVILGYLTSLKFFEVKEVFRGYLRSFRGHFYHLRIVYVCLLGSFRSILISLPRGRFMCLHESNFVLRLT